MSTMPSANAECCWGSALAIHQSQVSIIIFNQELYRKKHMAVFIANKIETSREVL